MTAAPDRSACTPGCVPWTCAACGLALRAAGWAIGEGLLSGNLLPRLPACLRGTSHCRQPGAAQTLLRPGRGNLTAIHVIDGALHPAVLEQPRGDLRIAPRAQSLKLSLVIPTYNESKSL